jgi:ribosomal protein L11 methyltransferase
MQWIEARVGYWGASPALAGELIADLFMENGLQGVVIEEPEGEAGTDWAAGLPPPAPQRAISGFFPAGQDTERRLLALVSALDRRSAAADFEWRLQRREVDEGQWAEAWKRFFWPRRVGLHLVVKPSWRRFSPRARDVVLEIDPGMAFGTGTHATTVLSLELLERLIRPGDAVLDLGTGSGLLLLAAARLGAASGVGIDQDPLAASIARQNLIRNMIDPAGFGVLCGDLAAPLRNRYDLVLANILSGTILRLLPEMTDLLSAAGRFVLSGITAGNRDRVLAAMGRHRLAVQHVLEREGWVALAGGGR